MKNIERLEEVSDMWSLNEVINEARYRGEIVVIDKPLRDEYEPTKALMKAEELDKVVLFRVTNKYPECVGNLVGSRQKLHRLLRVNNDVEAYEKLIKAISTEKEFSDWFTEYSFSEFYTLYEGDYRRLPSIKFFERDGGHYIDTSVLIAKTPDIDSYNASVHRLMLVEGGFAVRLVPRHLFRIYEENKMKGLETPVAIAVGVHPLVFIASSLSPPYGVFEFSLASILSEAKVPIVRTPKYGLPVVAGTSVIMEGKITLDLVNEGPFVDLLNLYDVVRKQPLIRVESIYLLKDNPLFHVILPGGKEHKIFMGAPREALIWDSVRRVVPKVVKVRLTDGGGQWLHAVISIERNHEGDGKNAALAAFAGHPSLKHVVIVDSDIDPDKPGEVEWAIATRFQASKGLIVIKGSRGSTLDPSSDDGLTDKVAVIATYPLSRKTLFEKPRIPEV